jgi:hypothetical protein
VQGILDVFHPNSAVGTLRPRIWSGTALYMDFRFMIPDDTLLVYRMYGPTSTSRSRSCTWEYRRHKRAECIYAARRQEQFMGKKRTALLG